MLFDGFYGPPHGVGQLQIAYVRHAGGEVPMPTSMFLLIFFTLAALFLTITITVISNRKPERGAVIVLLVAPLVAAVALTVGIRAFLPAAETGEPTDPALSETMPGEGDVDASSQGGLEMEEPPSDAAGEEPITGDDADPAASGEAETEPDGAEAPETTEATEATANPVVPETAENVVADPVPVR